MKKELYRRGLALLLAGCTLLSCAACGGGAKAAAMRLRRTEGTVGVSDDGGKGVEPRENLGLYSGYGVDTQQESYAWIDLDKVKLAKLDQDSEIEITKDGKDLEIEVISGSVFFNVTEPLKDDETMEICASTMVVGIRGTCGWVALSEDGKSLSVWLLEGKVRCEVGGEKETVRAGEMAVMTEDGEITVKEFSTANIPAFVQDELDGELLEQVENLLPQGPSPEVLAALEGAAYYGDPAACAITPEQAAAFAQVIRDNIAELDAMRASAGSPWIVNGVEVNPDIPSVYTAALFDLGDGTPALIFAGGTLDHQWDNRYSSFWPQGKCGIWLYQNGSAVQYAPGAGRQAFFDGYLLTGGMRELTEDHIYEVYPISGGAISGQPSATADMESHIRNSTIAYSYFINDTEVSFDDFDAWVGQWVGAEYNASSNDWTGDTSLVGISNGTDLGCSSWGLSPAADILSALELLAGAQ